MTRLVLRGLADRARSLALSVLTVALGAGLVTATLALAEAADRRAAGGAGAGWSLSGAPVVAVAGEAEIARTPLGEPARLAPGTVARLKRAPGVARVTVEAPFAAYVVVGDRVLGDRTDRSWGHSWALAEAESLTPREGGAPDAAGEVVLDARTAAEAGLGPGDRARVLTADGIAEVLVTGVTGLDGGSAGGGDRAVFFSPGEAADRGGDPVLAVLWPEEGTYPARLAEEVGRDGGVRVLTGGERAGALALDRAERELASGMGGFLGTVAAVVLAVAAVMTAGLLSAAVRGRSGEFALLRLAGATPGTVRRLVAAEALLLGCVAAVLSCPAGALTALLLTGLFDAMGVLPDGFAPVLDGSAFAVGAVLAVSVPLLACWRPALAAGRVAPVEAMRAAQAAPAPFSRFRLAGACAALAGAVALLGAAWALAASEAAVAAALAAAVLLVGAAALAAPALVRGFARLLRPLARGNALLLVAVEDARADPRQVAGVLVPLLVTAAVTCLLLFQGPTTAGARLHAYGERLAADLVVSGPVGVGLPASAAREAARVPGVAAVGGFRQTVTAAGGAPLSTHLVDPGTAGDLYRLHTEQGSWAGFGADGVAAHADTARAHGWRVGETVALTGPDGAELTARLTVLYRAGPDFPRVLLPRAALAPRLLDATDSALYVRLDPAADARGAALLLEEALDAVPGALVSDRAGHLAEQARLGEGDDWILLLAAALVAGFAGISAANTMVVSVSARSARLALLRLVGATRFQAAVTVAGEALAVSLAGLVLGSAAALAGLAATGRALTGDAVVLAVPPGQYLLVAACVMGMGLLAGLGSAAAALRVRPLRAADDQRSR
ncbi:MULTISPECIES: ABC transporter permease [unclassified Nocardiopsis]|uniref:ABC transporter permease n=1 Tax=unclassified Nocardiopsis TaxID=2649073 RepID=UPI00135C7DF9|nr:MULTISPECIES: ABC transporter permease [unclassified Nocardiopsis]